MELSEEEKRILELIKQKIEKSNKYIIYVDYPDLLDLIKIIDKQQKEIENSISKDKIESLIDKFRKIKAEIFSNENVLGRASITYDIVRNDYCEKMLNELLEGN